MRNWICRAVTGSDDIEQFVDLEAEVWGLQARDTIPLSLLQTIIHTGGLLVGAFIHESTAIGAALAFPARIDGRPILWSHATGVLPLYQGMGIGFDLKQFQRSWALKNGFDLVAWTYDPLQSGNANFNLHYLGVTSSAYHVDFYGVMQDKINDGLPSDRLEVRWNLRSKRVSNLAVAAGSGDRMIHDQDLNWVLLANSQGFPEILVVDYEDHRKCILAEIPSDLIALKKRNMVLALEWRLALRKVMVSALSSGFAIKDFVRLQDRCAYVLERVPVWWLYVVECRDGSLYTGITSNLERRVRAHNTGTGAAYTAAKRPVILRGAWEFAGRGPAQQAEAALKSMTRPQKLALLSGHMWFMGARFRTVKDLHSENIAQ